MARLEGKSTTAKDQIEHLADKEKGEVAALFIKSIIWTCGAVLDEPSRKVFEKVIRKSIAAITSNTDKAKWMSA